EYISARDIELYKSNKKEVLDDLKNYLLNDGNSLDGDEIQKHLFPEENIDIFLSHSHGDEDKVIKLAILLERKGLKVFVDSCVWGNAFDLLKVIDKKYCLNTNGSAYNYDKRNYSTSHVYMMLNTALHKMIDNCEVFLFLGTPNSVSVKDGIKNEESLKSPWIFSELAFIQHVR
ncbi:toll/interleukin-1 receptor domain-containing protein, partial [Acinetobacter lactucae]|uniref:toll/interleukin-1 receptor domain-containing protein n=1 Tax=Acinetobacter lactucae TaxID=1785128 RepID=UPI001580FBA4